MSENNQPQGAGPLGNYTTPVDPTMLPDLQDQGDGVLYNGGYLRHSDGSADAFDTRKQYQDITGTMFAESGSVLKAKIADLGCTDCLAIPFGAGGLGEFFVRKNFTEIWIDSTFSTTMAPGWYTVPVIDRDSIARQATFNGVGQGTLIQQVAKLLQGSALAYRFDPRTKTFHPKP